MSLQPIELLASCNVPDANRVIPRRGELSSVGGKRNSTNVALHLFKPAHLDEGSSIPNADAFAVAAGQEFAVGRERRHAATFLYLSLQFAGRSVPDSQRALR